MVDVMALFPAIYELNNAPTDRSKLIYYFILLLLTWGVTITHIPAIEPVILMGREYLASTILHGEMPYACITRVTNNVRYHKPPHFLSEATVDP